MDQEREGVRWPSFTRHDLRDGILFVGGLLGIFYETVFAAQVSEVLVLLFAAMIGLPAFLRADEGRQEKRED